MDVDIWIWMSRGILVSRKQKNHLSHTCIKSPTPVNVSSFKNTEIRSSDMLKKFILKNNQKQIKKTCGKHGKFYSPPFIKLATTKIDISNLTVNGVNFDDPQEMACHFNKFFASIATKTVENINPSKSLPDDLIEQNSNFFSFSNKTLTKTEILEATKLLADKNTPDYTGVSTSL